MSKLYGCEHVCPCCECVFFHGKDRHDECDKGSDWVCAPCDESIVNGRCVNCNGEEEY